MFGYKYPILNARIEEGSIYIVGLHLIGIAADGVKVSIGSIESPELAERYLTDFPTPDVW